MGFGIWSPLATGTQELRIVLVKQPEALLVAGADECPGPVLCDHHLDLLPEGGARVPDPDLGSAIHYEAATISPPYYYIASWGDM